MVNKAYPFRIYPNKTFGCSRFVLNFFLNKQKEKIAISLRDPSVFAGISHFKQTVRRLSGE
ncbi:MULTISPECIES: helix-turn-helix domain-containing protein [Geobacillus]|uniref:Helix-turn-helix domain-containing protein n=1 Tax=Geobacillus thermodenitrificans TaxID=33940 RepID=A0ABY9QGW4_GEOTD|nr:MULTISPECIES: helix-turn-helix domain-containing protein [Geobacillus]MED3906663.1 helix-turn-helix domain-containing protein [Geobacillus thermodenitrificans]WMV78124.1 helix-turn-helix domain-containing protein [Geobacillus thermodenitrificans]